MTDETKEILTNIAALALQYDGFLFNLCDYKVTVFINHVEKISYPVFFENTAQIIYDEYDVREICKNSEVDSLKVLLYEKGKLLKRKIVDCSCVQETIYL